jgi:aminoglycoside phosphotransferase (APT) family kinase protein
MDFVEGHVLRSARLVEQVLDEDGRKRAGEHLVDVLATIHDVDVDVVGLGDLGRREGYIERQLKRWYGQFKQSQAQEEEAGIAHEAAVVDEVYEALAARVPAQHDVSIAHGDYRLDNTMVGADGKVQAVLDWELCTLGDPLADLGTLTVYWATRPADGSTPGPATALPGFPTKDEMVARYADASGRDVSNLPYYVAFAHWKLACIVEGVYARYAAGAMGGDPTSADGMAAQVVVRAERARAALAQL